MQTESMDTFGEHNDKQTARQKGPPVSAVGVAEDELSLTRLFEDSEEFLHDIWRVLARHW